MSSSVYVRLSAALSWIAFGEWTDSVTPWNDYAQAKQQLEDALLRFLDKASGGVISVRGRFAEVLEADPIGLDTSDVPAAQFHDFRQFDLTCSGLRRGEGLLGFPEEDGDSFRYVYQPLSQPGFYRDVLVSRIDVEREFPASFVGPKATHIEMVQWCERWLASGKLGMNQAWPAFSNEPRFKGCSRDDCFRPAWNEAKRINKQ